MEDKIERLFEAIKPTNSHFSELVITELVDDIIGNNPQKARLLLLDINHKLEEFLCTELNSTIQEYSPLDRYWNDIKNLCFLRFSAEWNGYKYDYYSREWKKEELVSKIIFPCRNPYNELLQPIEPYGDEFCLYKFITQDNTFIPFNGLLMFLCWKWEGFRCQNPSLEFLDSCYKAKEILHRHGGMAACIYYHKDTSLYGYDMMTCYMAKYIHALKSESEISHSENNTATIRKNSGRKQTRFQDCINGKYESQSDEIIDRISTLINNRKGKRAAMVLIAAIQKGYIRNPEYAATMREFKNSNIVRRDFAKYLDKGQSPDLWTDKEIEELKRKLTV